MCNHMHKEWDDRTSTLRLDQLEHEGYYDTLNNNSSSSSSNKKNRQAEVTKSRLGKKIKLRLKFNVPLQLMFLILVGDE